VFGEAEQIAGYSQLAVHVYLSAASGHAFVDIRYEAKCAGADDVEALLRAWWPRGFATDRDAFLDAVAAAPRHDWASLGRRLAQPGRGAAHTPQALSSGAGAAAGAAGPLELYHAKLADTPAWFKVRLQRVALTRTRGVHSCRSAAARAMRSARHTRLDSCRPPSGAARPPGAADDLHH
jgi:hypothetical protein